MYHVGQLMARLMDVSRGTLNGQANGLSCGTLNGQANGCITWDN